MQNVDISKLVTDALLVMGCDRELISDLDSHSDIVLDFHHFPSIHLMRDGDDIRLWAALGERHDYRRLIDAHAPQLLQELMPAQPCARGGSLMMSIQDETMQLSTLVHPEYLADSEKFSEALNEFFARLGVFKQIVGA